MTPDLMMTACPKILEQHANELCLKINEYKTRKQWYFDIIKPARICEMEANAIQAEV